MAAVALITWLVTAAAGAYMLATWLIRRRALRRLVAIGRAGGRPPPYLPPPLLLVHPSLAAAGLCVWIAYLVVDLEPLAWLAAAILTAVAALGVALLLRWLGSRRARWAAARRSHGPAESYFPVAVVLGHGLLGATTLALVLLTALGVGRN